MLFKSKIFTYRLAILVALLLLVAYLIPFLFGVSFKNLDSLLPVNDGFYPAGYRSVAFAFFSSIINVFIGLYFAVRLNTIKLFSRKGLLLSLLIIPCLLGNVSTSFIYKFILDDFVSLQQNTVQKTIVALLIQFWQFGTLFTYIIWLVLKNIDVNKIVYGQVGYFTRYEKFRDILLPSAKNTLILLFIINFLFSVYEDSKMQLIFKSSRGTNTELINQFLNRTYQSDSLLNPITARTETYSLSFFFILFLLIFLLIVVSLLLVTINKVLTKRRPMPSFFNIKLPNLSFYFLLLFVLLPLLSITGHVFSNFNLKFEHLFYPFLLSILTAFICLLVAIIIGVVLRIGWIKFMTGLNIKSQFVFYSILLFQFIPGIVISLLGYQWFLALNLDLNYVFVIWIIGHILMILPLISCLLITTHFNVSNNQLYYLFSHNLSFIDFVRVLFWGKFKGDYLLTFLICLTMIWNDSILNSILSDYVPSFISEMKMSIVGRGADYSKGISYFAVSLIVAFGAYSIWVRNFILKKRQNGAS